MNWQQQSENQLLQTNQTKPQTWKLMPTRTKFIENLLEFLMYSNFICQQSLKDYFSCDSNRSQHTRHPARAWNMRGGSTTNHTRGEVTPPIAQGEVTPPLTLVFSSSTIPSSSKLWADSAFPFIKSSNIRLVISSSDPALMLPRLPDLCRLAVGGRGGLWRVDDMPGRSSPTQSVRQITRHAWLLMQFNDPCTVQGATNMCRNRTGEWYVWSEAGRGSRW